MKILSLGVLLALAIAVPRAQAASAKAYSQITGPQVKLSDLFDGISHSADRILGAAPAPGQRLVVPAAQLAAIARDFGVVLVPGAGGDQVVLVRDGVAVLRRDVTAVLRAALMGSGVAPDSEIVLTDFTPPIVPRDGQAQMEIGDVQYDAQSGRFVAMLMVSDTTMAPAHQRLAGVAQAMADVVVLTRHLAAGAVLREGDVRASRVRLATLYGRESVALAAALGAALRRDTQPDTPLTLGDIGRPLLVVRGANVRMRLETGGITLTALGVALEAGGAGDVVRVMNPTSHAIVQAAVQADGALLVTPTNEAAGPPSGIVHVALAP